MILAVILAAVVFFPMANDSKHTDGDYVISVNSNVKETETEKKEENTFELTLICVGDSITHGDGSGDIVSGSYTSVLKEMLPDGCNVLNFGRSGSTALNDTAPHIPYIETKEYKSSLLSDPDIVIIMLGTNDSWYIADRADGDYISALENIVNIYSSLKSKPDVYLCTPPKRFTNDACAEATDTFIVPAVRSLCKEKSISMIDIYQITSEQEDLYFDGIHLGKKGYTLIASKIYSVVCGSHKFLNK